SKLEQFVAQALQEDVGDGDHTSLSTISAEARGEAELLVKDSGILAGVAVAKDMFHIIDPALQIDVSLEDGTEVKSGDIALFVQGSVHSILKAERLVLNVMQRMSGIATKTNLYAKQLIGTKSKV